MLDTVFYVTRRGILTERFNCDTHESLIKASVEFNDFNEFDRTCYTVMTIAENNYSFNFNTVLLLCLH